MPKSTTPITTTDNTGALAIIALEARATAASFGITCPDDLALSLVERLVKRIGGQKIYIPSETSSQARRRSAQIRAQFVGNNIAALARAHCLTPRQVRRIISQSPNAVRPAPT